MAAFTPKRCWTSTARAMVAYGLLLAVAVPRASARQQANDWRCPIADTAVFPYWSFCSNPAVYGYGYGGQAYQLVEPVSGLALGPGWDYSNSDVDHLFLVPFGALYSLSPQARKFREYVTLKEDLVFTNIDTGRVLAWRNEGDDGDFLVEVDADVVQGTVYEFAPNDDVDLPCPLIYPPPQCHAYSILDFNSTSGLAPYYKEGVTYFKKSTTNLSAFVLVDASSSSLRRNMISQIV